MPYSSIEELPESVRKVLPVKGQELFVEVFNDSFGRTGSEATAFRTAWSIIKKRFRKVDGKFVANSSDFTTKELFTFSLEPAYEQTLVYNSDSDEVVLDAVLADTSKNKQGKWFSEEDLKQIAEQINTQGSTKPDTDHETTQKIFSNATGKPLEVVMNEIKRAKGFFKNIKAAVRDGKLWIKAFLDSTYKSFVDKFEGLSIEAIGDRTDEGRVKNPKYIGFTFTDSPQLEAAQIAQ